jgi:hypothetical protein
MRRLRSDDIETAHSAAGENGIMIEFAVWRMVDLGFSGGFLHRGLSFATAWFDERIDY